MSPFFSNRPRLRACQEAFPVDKDGKLAMKQHTKSKAASRLSSFHRGGAENAEEAQRDCVRALSSLFLSAKPSCSLRLLDELVISSLLLDVLLKPVLPALPALIDDWESV